MVHSLRERFIWCFDLVLMLFSQSSVILISLSEMIKSSWHTFSTCISSLTSISWMEHFNALGGHETIEIFANEFLWMGHTGLQVRLMQFLGLLLQPCGLLISDQPICWCTCEQGWRSPNSLLPLLPALLLLVYTFKWIVMLWFYSLVETILHLRYFLRNPIYLLISPLFSPPFSLPSIASYLIPGNAGLI